MLYSWWTKSTRWLQPRYFDWARGKDNNPHKTKYCDNNNKYLGDDDKGYGKEWNDKYKLDLIGRNYCRDRSIACSKDEYMFLIDWKKQKSQFVIAHQKWISSILKQMKEIKIGLKGYKYLDEAIELSTELGLNINDAEIIRTNSTGLTIYNPKNLADRIKGMKNQERKNKRRKNSWKNGIYATIRSCKLINLAIDINGVLL